MFIVIDLITMMTLICLTGPSRWLMNWPVAYRTPRYPPTGVTSAPHSSLASKSTSRQPATKVKGTCNLLLCADVCCNRIRLCLFTSANPGALFVGWLIKDGEHFVNYIEKFIFVNPETSQ